MVLVHFDDTPSLAEKAVADYGLCCGVSLVDRVDMVRRHYHSSGDNGDSLFVLLPESLEEHAPHAASRLEPASVVWYTDDLPPTLPEFSERGDVWVVNGNTTLIVDWEAARSAARRRDCDVLVFDSPESATRGRYSESVRVDESGRVVRFRRHYADSPGSVGLLRGSASFLVCSGEHARAVVAHVVVHGWGLDSVGGLTRRFHVGWSDVASLNANALLQYDKRSDDSAYRFAKRFMDIALSATALLLLLPFVLAVALLVKLTSRGPVFFGHKRQGLGGSEFQCLKFRTMVEGANEMQPRLRADNEVDGPQFKITKDPRLTRLGAWMQRYNVDEIPQFINVLCGEMSLVGPRPSPDNENQFCPGWRRTRLSVRPGITGLWQVLRRRDHADSDFQEWILYDLEYVRHASFRLDWQLLLYTPLAMFAPRRLRRFARELNRRGITVHPAWICESDSSPQHSAPDGNERGMGPA